MMHNDVEPDDAGTCGNEEFTQRPPLPGGHTGDEATSLPPGGQPASRGRVPDFRSRSIFPGWWPGQGLLGPDVGPYAEGLRGPQQEEGRMTTQAERAVMHPESHDTEWHYYHGTWPS